MMHGVSCCIGAQDARHGAATHRRTEAVRWNQITSRSESLAVIPEAAQRLSGIHIPYIHDAERQSCGFRIAASQRPE
jgi:hypothetical protein